MSTHSAVAVPAVKYTEIYYQAVTTVYLASNLVLVLTENGGANNNATIASGVYTAATFATALAAALTAASQNTWIYTALTSGGITTLPTTSTLATSYSVTNNGPCTNTFTIV